MLDDDSTLVQAAPTSPLEWILRLEKRLNADAKVLRLYDDYYEGRHSLMFATPKFRDAFGNLFKEFADNWCAIVVDAVEERLNVEGFRFGDNEAGDKKAWAIWQANQLDAESQLAHTESLINGRSYSLVWDNPDNPKIPAITIEHPAEVVVTCAAGNRRLRLAALKRWIDDSGYIFGTLYLPDGIYKYRSKSKAKSNRFSSVSTTSWVPRETGNEQWPLPNPLGVVPIIPLCNRPRLLSDGISEIRDVIPVQNGINKLITDMMVASEFGAAPQRWATGLEVPKDPISGQPIEIFKTLLDRMWATKSRDVSFGQFAATDLTNFVSPIELLVQHVASQSRTPPHYFYLSGQFPSGESIKSAEAGLVAKTRRKMRHLGEAWEETERLGFAVIGDKGRSQQLNCETIWADPEYRTESQHIDATVKLRALNVPLRILWERAGFTQTEIDRFWALLVEERAQLPVQDVPTQPSETISLRG